MSISSEPLKAARAELDAISGTLRVEEINRLVSFARGLVAQRDSAPASVGSVRDAVGGDAAYGKRVELVNRLNLELAGLHDLGLFFGLTAKYMRLIFPQIGRASISRVVPSGEHLEIFALDGASGTVPTGTKLPIQGTLIGKVVTERRPILITPTNQEPMLDVGAMRKLGFQGIYSAPLISGKQVLGTINMAAVEADAYSAHDELLIAQVAATLAVNVERWQLVERLNDSLHRLEKANEELQNELVERGRATERLAERERVIEEQHRQLLAMSTPLIPITDRVAVMPLVGALSANRARQVFETALDGARALGIDVVILDITGLEHLDTEVASTLVNMAKSLRLLGSRTFLTGVRPEVAQTLVALEADLTELSAFGTLQRAIAFSLADFEDDGRTGSRRTRRRA